MYAAGCAAFASLLTIAFWQQAFAALPDIAGLKLGMTTEEAEQAVGPSFKTVEYGQSKDGIEHRFMLLKPFEGYAVETLNGKVIFVDHTQLFTEETKPSTSKTVQALVAKYGKPSFPSVPETVLFYAYDKGGNIIRNTPPIAQLNVKVCAAETSSAPVVMPPNPDKTPYRGEGGNLFLTFPETAKADCR